MRYDSLAIFLHMVDIIKLLILLTNLNNKPENIIVKIIGEKKDHLFHL